MSRPKKQFTFSYAIDLSNVTYEPKNTEIETHFSIPWCMVYHKYDNRLSFGVLCLYTESDEWEIQTELTFRIKSTIGNTMQVTTERSFQNTKDQKNLSWWWNESVSLERIQKHFAENGKVEIEADVVIRKMNGFGKEKLRYFDEFSQKYWDVIISVDDHKFYLLRAYLASQSTYFDKLFFGVFKESNQTEIKLKEMDHEDFQSFLELIHGEPAVDDNNIDGVLHLADMFDAPTAIRRCEEFLIERSKWSLEDKIQLAGRYNLNDLTDVVPKREQTPQYTWFSWIRTVPVLFYFDCFLLFSMFVFAIVIFLC